MQQEPISSTEAAAAAGSAPSYAQFEAALAKPSPEVLEAIELIAQKLKLDADLIVGGEPIQTDDMVYWISHFGAQDPHGLMLVLNGGPVIPGYEAEVMRNLLHYNASTPAALGGYFGILPHCDAIGFFIRVDAKVPAEAAETLLGCIGAQALFMKEMQRAFEASAAGADSEAEVPHGVR